MRLHCKRTVKFTFLFIFLSACGSGGITLESGATTPKSENAYYVKNGGDDSRDGRSDATAWASISRVRLTARQGDTVYFRSQDTWSALSGGSVLEATAGVTYDGSSYGSGTRATLKAAGAMESVVKIYVGDVTFRGFNVDGNKQTCGGLYIGYHAKASFSNVTVDNCLVHDNGHDSSYVYGFYIGSIFNSPLMVRNITVTNTTVYNTAHEAFAIYPTWQYPNNKVDGVLIRNCTAYNSGLYGQDWSDGISVTNDADNVTIEFSTVYNNFRGLSVSTSSVNTGSPNNLTVRYNMIHDNTVAGIIFICPSGITGDGSFYGNLLYNNGRHWLQDYAADIIIGGYDYTTSVFNFYNNTIYSPANGAANKCAVWVGPWSPINGTPAFNFKNNIVYSGNYSAICDNYNKLTHSNNLIYRSSGASDEHVNNGKSYNRAGILAWEQSARNTDPHFAGGTLPTGFIGAYGFDMAPNTSYFSIASGDALDNGATLGIPYNGCINGAGLATPITRPQGAAYDIGAYEK